MTTAWKQPNPYDERHDFEKVLSQADCADLRRHNDELQRQNDILTGRVQRLNALLVLREREIDNQTAAIETLRGDLAALNETCDRIARAGMHEIDARDLGY